MSTAAPGSVAPVEQGRHWALFADWCTATDRWSLPATPDTILDFLAELRAGPATVRRRLAAVDAAHRHAGYPPPSAGPSFDTLLRPPRPARFDPNLVATALAIIPVGGWPIGIVGRRDAALLALTCSAGLTRRQIQALRTPSTDHAGTSQMTEPGGGVGEWALPAVTPAEDPGTCSACAIARWRWVAATIAAEGWRTVRNHLADLGEETADSQTDHHCTRPDGGLEVTAEVRGGWWDQRQVDRWTVTTARMPLFCAIDRHGTPQSGYPLSTRTITTIVAARLAAAAHTDRQQPGPTSQTGQIPGARGTATTTPGSSPHDKPPRAASPATKTTSTKLTPTQRRYFSDSRPNSRDDPDENHDMIRASQHRSTKGDASGIVQQEAPERIK